MKYLVVHAHVHPPARRRVQDTSGKYRTYLTLELEGMLRAMILRWMKEDPYAYSGNREPENISEIREELTRRRLHTRDADGNELLEYLTTFFYADGTSETVRVRVPDEWTNERVYEFSSDRRRFKMKKIKSVDGPHEQLRMF